MYSVLAADLFHISFIIDLKVFQTTWPSRMVAHKPFFKNFELKKSILEPFWLENQLNWVPLYLLSAISI